MNATTDNGDSQAAAEIWAILKETARRQEETSLHMKETDRRMEETSLHMKETDRRMEETDRRMKETDRLMEEAARRQKETDRMIKEASHQTSLQMKKTFRRLEKQFGDMGNRFGDVIEHMLATRLPEKFLAFGYKFEQVNRNSNIKNIVTGQRIAEIDVLLMDGEYDMAVEVKTKPDKKDVDEHVARLKKIRSHYDGKGRSQKILGAIAGAVFDETVLNYAVENGLFVVCQSGDAASINVPEGFQPREW